MNQVNLKIRPNKEMGYEVSQQRMCVLWCSDPGAHDNFHYKKKRIESKLLPLGFCQSPHWMTGQNTGGLPGGEAKTALRDIFLCCSQMWVLEIIPTLAVGESRWESLQSWWPLLKLAPPFAYTGISGWLWSLQTISSFQKTLSLSINSGLLSVSNRIGSPHGFLAEVLSFRIR